MINKLQAIREKKDRAEEEYSEAIRDTVRALKEENPMWSLQEIADTVKLTRQRVSQLLQSPRAEHRNVPAEAVKELKAVALKCGYCGITFERLERVHLARKALGHKATYCSGACQKAGFGESRKLKAPRTECSKGHALSPNNTTFVTTRSASGGVYHGQRCRICRNSYARSRYHKNKQAKETAKSLTESLNMALAEARANDRVV